MGIFEVIVVVLYLLLMAYLGFLGFRRTRSSADYLLAGRQIHPFIMAMSYGAAFISTSAIVGFGGVAGTFGMSLMWLVFLNIFMGIFVAFVFLGGPTRRMGHRLGAHTFPELLGKRYESRFIQIAAGLIIFVFMPLYATAVLLGGAEFVLTIFRFQEFEHALLVLALVVGAYVLAGGLKGVMYNDALQGSVMVFGMLLLAILTYTRLGGIGAAHHELSDMADLVPENLQAIGHAGWTRFPAFGWGDARYNLWWTLVSTITLGVGIGVLAQPQMAVRFMTVKSRRELNRAVAVGGIFILIIPGVAYTTGALSNAYFRNHEVITGALISQDDTSITVNAESGGRVGAIEIIPLGPDSIITDLGDGRIAVEPRLISTTRAGGTDQIIPTYIHSAMPRWFGLLFLLVLLSAAVSTLSSQFHAMGTAIGRDILETLFAGIYTPSDRATILITRCGVVVGLVASVLGAHYLRGYIAIATAMFFGLCAAAFLPAFAGGLFCRRMTRPAAIASMLGGFSASLFWMAFFFERTAGALGICQALTGRTVLLTAPNWPLVDPLLIGLPVSTILAIGVSLFTKPPQEDHIRRCFE